MIVIFNQQIQLHINNINKFEFFQTEMVLSKSQTEQLNKDILEYLANNSYERTAQVFAQEAKLNLTDVDMEGKKLQLKWKSIISLQKKITTLQDKNKNLQEKLASNPANTGKIQEIKIQELFQPKLPEKFAMQGHKNNVTSLAFHPQYSQIASSSEDGTIKLWEFQNGEYERTLKGHVSAVNCVTYDNSGKKLASCSSDLTIKLWDLTDYVCLKTFYGHNHNVSFVSFIFDGDYIISASRDKTIKLWEISTGFCKRTFIGHDDWVRQVVSTSDSKILASCSTDQNILLWNSDKDVPYLTIKAHDNVIQTVKFIQNERSQFLVGSDLLKSKFKTSLKVLKEKQIQQKNQNGIQQSQHLFVISGSRDKTIKLFSCANGQQLHNFVGHDNWVRDLAIHPTGKWLYSAADDKTIRIWDFNYGKQKKKIDAHDHFISSIKFNSKYGVIATSGQDMIIKIWSLR